jgi:hypothetical protein
LLKRDLLLRAVALDRKRCLERHDPLEGRPGRCIDEPAIRLLEKEGLGELQGVIGLPHRPCAGGVRPTGLSLEQLPKAVSVDLPLGA